MFVAWELGLRSTFGMGVLQVLNTDMGKYNILIYRQNDTNKKMENEELFLKISSINTWYEQDGYCDS